MKTSVVNLLCPFFLFALIFSGGAFGDEEAQMTFERGPSSPAAKFGEVFGDQFAAAAFVATGSKLDEAVLWFCESPNGTILVDVRKETPTGPLVAQALLPAHQSGKTRVCFPDDVYLEPGGMYVLVVHTGEPATTEGALLASAGSEAGSLPSWTHAGWSGNNLAFGIKLSEWVGPVPESSLSVSPVLPAGYRERIDAALASGSDLFGQEVLARSEGPTWENVKDYLTPLLYCGTMLTDSGVYYIPFGRPISPLGIDSCALHVGDGSQIITPPATGPKMTVFVGDGNRERYGSSTARLEESALDDGYYPILQNVYTSEEGFLIRQESFTTFCADAAGDVSFVRFAFERGTAKSTRTAMSLVFSDSGLVQSDKRMLIGENLRAVTDRIGVFDAGSLTFPMDTASESESVIYLARLVNPSPCQDFAIDSERYRRERAALKQYWDEKLDNGTVFEIPEKRVSDAMKNLLIQNLCHGWRYSIGNAYESWYDSEGNDMAVTMGMFGFQEEQRSIHQFILQQELRRYANWSRGERLVAAAKYYYLTGDATYIEENREALLSIMEELSRQILNPPDRLMDKQSLCGDIAEPGDYTPHLSVCWRGLRDMALIFAELGKTDYANKYAHTAEEFREAILAGIEKSLTVLPDGGIFIPLSINSESKVEPYEHITDSRIGSYWNLVMPYAFESGVLTPEWLRGVYQYTIEHGSYLLGMVRFNYYPVEIGQFRSDGLSGYKTSGVDNVYGPGFTQLLASMDDADRLVLMLYSKLAHGMTRGTFISGEGDTVGVFPGEYYRTMYLPPSSYNNSWFLDLVRIGLIHEICDDQGRPCELVLGGSTPRSWLEEGKTIRVKNAPSFFGPLDLEIASHLDQDQVTVTVRLPDRVTPEKTKLRLRVPKKSGEPRKIASVTLNGNRFDAWNQEDESLDLTALKGVLELVICYQ